jgi:hypothetical protein
MEGACVLPTGISVQRFSSQLYEAKPTTMDSSSGRLEELAVKRKETKTPKSPMVCGGRYITIDKMRNTPPSIWAKGQPSKSK